MTETAILSSLFNYNNILLIICTLKISKSDCLRLQFYERANTRKKSYLQINKMKHIKTQNKIKIKLEDIMDKRTLTKQLENNK